MGTVSTEAHGLLEVEQSDDADDEKTRQRKRYRYGTSGAAACVFFLLVCVAGGIAIILTSSVSPRPLSADQQIQILDEISRKGKQRKFEGCESVLLLMRHCEKMGKETEDLRGNQHCSKVGSERAEYIATLFGDDSRWSLPSHMYAMSRARPGVHHLNYREIETLKPLKDKSGTDIDTSFTEGTERLLAKDFFQRLASGQLCGKTTIVNWKHSRIQIQAEALGCGLKQGCPGKYKKHEFDVIWEIRYWAKDGSKNIATWTVSGKVVNEGFKK